MRLYRLPAKSDKGADMFVDLDQVEMVSCRMENPTPNIQDIVGGDSKPAVAIIRLGTVAGRNVEFSLGSVELAQQWLQTKFSLVYEFTSN